MLPGTDKPNDPQPEPADSPAPADKQDTPADKQDTPGTEEDAEFIARQVLEKDATFFGG
jgi:hypothetical protein